MVDYPLVNIQKAIENGHLSEFSHEKWWFAIVMLVYQRVVHWMVDFTLDLFQTWRMTWLILVILMLICWLNVIYIYIYICGIQLDFMGISGDWMAITLVISWGFIVIFYWISLLDSWMNLWVPEAVPRMTSKHRHLPFYVWIPSFDVGVTASVLNWFQLWF